MENPNRQKISQKVLNFFRDPAFATLFVIGVFLAIVIKVLFDKDFLTNLGKIEVARGLITSLLSIGMIGIGIVIISANYISQEIDDKIAQEKFNRGKDILSLFIGIFGAILGYYFGSNNLPTSTPTAVLISPPPSTTTTALIPPSTPPITTPLIPSSTSTTTAPLVSPSPKK